MASYWRSQPLAGRLRAIRPTLVGYVGSSAEVSGKVKWRSRFIFESSLLKCELVVNNTLACRLRATSPKIFFCFSNKVKVDIVAQVNSLSFDCSPYFSVVIKYRKWLISRFLGMALFIIAILFSDFYRDAVKKKKTKARAVVATPAPVIEETIRSRSRSSSSGRSSSRSSSASSSSSEKSKSESKQSSQPFPPQESESSSSSSTESEDEKTATEEKWVSFRLIIWHKLYKWVWG